LIGINLLLLIIYRRVKELWKNWSAVFRKSTKIISLPTNQFKKIPDSGGTNLLLVIHPASGAEL
jgi:hypothetical protein